jgi:hypothetical protein
MDRGQSRSIQKKGGTDMPHQVKIFKGHPDNGGKLVEVIRGESLSYVDDPAPENSKKRSKYKGTGKERPETITCAVCKRTVSFEHFQQRICRKVACIAEWKKIKEQRGKMVKRA